MLKIGNIFSFPCCSMDTEYQNKDHREWKPLQNVKEQTTRLGNIWKFFATLLLPGTVLSQLKRGAQWDRLTQQRALKYFIFKGVLLYQKYGIFFNMFFLTEGFDTFSHNKMLRNVISHWTQPLGPLCFWQCYFVNIINYYHWM